jgi:hypothetical protein
MPLGMSKRKRTQFLAHVQYVNLLGRNINTKKNTALLLVANKEADLEGSNEKIR